VIEYDLWLRLATVGATLILVYGKIFEKIRPKYYLFHCPMCVGFHVGWIFCLIYLLFFHTLETNSIFLLFKEGCITSLLSYCISMTFGDDGINISFRSGKNDG
jgi:hypothetical protein